jgi:DNA invertase Pin-like site-specific DNA recombinase
MSRQTMKPALLTGTADLAGNKIRAAIYARYSTKGQQDISVDDQIAYCKQHGERKFGSRLEVVKIYADRAKTGHGMLKRNDLNAMIEAAERGEFDIIIVESLDRLGRAPADLQCMFRDLEFAQIKIEAVNDGEVNQMLVTLRGMISFFETNNTSFRMRRHHTARAREGKILGVVSYGIRKAPEGSEVSHEKHPEEAKIVLRYFREFADGASTRTIAAGLNKDRVPPPSGRGTVWRRQTIAKMLVNRLYIGEYVYNRCQAVLNHHTESKIERARPKADWIVTAVPHLRIVPQPLWDAVQKSLAERSEAAGNRGHNKGKIVIKHSSLLGGIVRCSVCGADMQIVSGGTARRRFSCSGAAKGDDVCKHRRSYDVRTIEVRAVEYCIDLFSKPEVLDKFLRKFDREVVLAQKQAKGEIGLVEKRRREVEASIRKYMNLLETDGMPEDLVLPRVRELQAERNSLEQRRQAAENNIEKVTVLPNAIKLWHAALCKLADEIDNPPPELRQMVRTLLDHVRVYPTPKMQSYKLECLTRREVLASAGKAGFPEVRSVQRRGVIVNFDLDPCETSYGSISKNDNQVISLGIFTASAA